MFKRFSDAAQRWRAQAAKLFKESPTVTLAVGTLEDGSKDYGMTSQ